MINLSGEQYKSFKKIYKKSILNHCVYKLTSITVYCISSAVNGNAEPDSELDTVENAFLWIIFLV